MNTKLQGLAQRADKLLFLMEGHADKFAARLETLETRGPAVFARGHAVLSDREGHLNDIENFVKSMENIGGNGGFSLEHSAAPPSTRGATSA